MVRIYKNDIAYIVCEVKIFKNDISIGTTNSIINESYIKQIIKDPSDNSTIISLEGSFSIIVNENYDDFIILQLTNNQQKENKTRQVFNILINNIMRIVIFGIKDDSLTSEEIKKSLSKAFPNECGNIVAIETSYIAGRENCESQDSAFIRACKQLCVVCGDPTEEEAFRGAFWKAFFVDKAIEPIILKTVATGPRSTREYNALKGMNATFLPKLAISALTTLNEM